MKTSTTLITAASLVSAAVILSCVSANATDNGYEQHRDRMNHFSTSISMVTLNDNIRDIHKLSDAKIGLKVSIRDDFNKNFYSSIDAEKYDTVNKIDEGITFGVHQGAGMFRPVFEIGYQHTPDSDKLFTKDQFSYDGGVEIHYFNRMTHFIKWNDFADNENRQIKIGTSFRLTKHLDVFANYNFKAETKGTSAEAGVDFSFS